MPYMQQAPRITQVWNDRIKHQHAGDAAASAYRYGDLPKACVHPLHTPAGHCLTGFEPSDHVWHRGLWFTIKYINKTNFWEEHSPYGIQESITPPTAELLAADRSRVTHDVRWTSEATGPAVAERRSLTFKARDDGIRLIDWHTTLTAEQDLELDRTPYTTWGGYGGLSWRGDRELHAVSFTASSGDESESIAGNPYDWVLANARVDGGRDQRVAIGIVDHPANPRSAVPWYCKTGGGFTFMNAAFLFHEPMTLAEGQSLTFNYRVLYRDGAWSAEEFRPLAEAFRSSEVAQ